MLITAVEAATTSLHSETVMPLPGELGKETWTPRE
jgi:hypothetical protein